MNQSLHDVELIERYFDNLLSDSETAQLKNRLQTDPELKKLFNQEKLLVNTIRYQGAENDLRFLKDLEKRHAPSSTSHFKKYFYYYAAASVMLLIVAGLFFPLSDPSPEKLYASYFKPYPNIFEPTVRGTGSVNQRTEAFLAYDQGNYQRASELFTTLLKENHEPGMLLLLGNAHLSLGKIEEAKQNFTELIATDDDLDLQAKWFLSLCYLKSGEIDKAQTILKELGDTEVSYASKARELLKKVD